jgi:hypothetical protein
LENGKHQTATDRSNNQFDRIDDTYPSPNGAEPTLLLVSVLEEISFDPFKS